MDFDFYFTATDANGNTFIGYINGDESSEKIKIGTRKFNKIYNGKAFQDDKKTQCKKIDICFLFRSLWRYS